MNKTQITELLDGETNYIELVKLFEIEEYSKNSDKIYEICEQLCGNMPEDEKQKIMNKLFDANTSAELIVMTEYFKAGFKIGLTIGAQTFLE